MHLHRDPAIQSKAQCIEAYPRLCISILIPVSYRAIRETRDLSTSTSRAIALLGGIRLCTFGPKADSPLSTPFRTLAQVFRSPGSFPNDETAFAVKFQAKLFAIIRFDALQEVA